jgi:type I restriction enzyme S subunit
MMVETKSTMPFPTYPEYKASGFEWIGETPEHWRLITLKFIADLKSGESIDASNIKSNGNYPVYGGNGLRGYTSTFTHEGFFVLIGRQGALCGNINYAQGKFWASEHAVVCTLKGKDTPKWFGELLRTMNLNQYSVSAAQPGLSVDRIKNLKIPVPSIPEQTAIANFLDHKTAQIDAAISKHRQLIELLWEHRAALINEAVTKGLNPDAPMKDSGVEWIGEVPAHWEVKKLKHFCQIQGRIGFKGYKASDLTDKDNGALAIGGKHISPSNKLDLSSPTYLSWEKYYESPEIMVEIGHIIVTQRGTLGKVVLIEEDIGKATINPSMILLKEIKCNKKFLYYFFQSNFVLETINLMNTATAVPMISQSQLSNFIVLSPPLEEQQQIVDFIETQTTRIDREITLAQQEIELLEEYRQSLIAEAVTGKIDVRNYPLN